MDLGEARGATDPVGSAPDRQKATNQRRAARRKKRREVPEGAVPVVVEPPTVATRNQVAMARTIAGAVGRARVGIAGVVGGTIAAGTIVVGIVGFGLDYSLSP